MTNLIKTIHLVEYFSHRLTLAIARYENSKSQYEHAREVYEAHSWWYKLTKTPFEKTSKGDLSWSGSSRWSMMWDEDEVSNLGVCLKICQYHLDNGTDSMEWMFSQMGFDQKGFYSWVSKNEN